MKVHWLWEPYLPRGKLAILDGDPGVGKSLLTVDIAARLSRAAPLPNGVVPDHPHVTLLLGAEDAAADTTRPRAEAAGADLDRLLVMETSDGAPLFFPARLPELEEAIRAHGADLVVIDPIMAFLPPEVAATLDQCVRLGLSPMAALAARTDCAILLVRHLRKTESKRAVHRGLGSIGIIASARTGLVAGPNPADPSQNILAVTKVNPGVVAPSLGYRIQSDADGRAVVAWTGRAELSADTMNRSPAPLLMCDQAAVWLSAQLAAGPRTATELYAAAAAACIPERTLERAKSQLRIGSRKVRLKDRSVWYWFDWGAEWPKNAPFKKPDPFELPSIEDFIT
jgi:putative DNA primase/helicase